MAPSTGSLGRRERAKEDKRCQITNAARALFTERGVGGVTTQQIADRADVAIGTLYLDASTKAELQILVQNQKLATATDDGFGAASTALGAGADTVAMVFALIDPVVACICENPENGRSYLHELASATPTSRTDVTASSSPGTWKTAGRAS